jgi:hypothetical protein
MSSDWNIYLRPRETMMSMESIDDRDVLDFEELQTILLGL